MDGQPSSQSNQSGSLRSQINHQIVDMATDGAPPSTISDELCIPKSYVVKILTRYEDTGSTLSTGHRKSPFFTPRIKARIHEIKNSDPGISSWNIRAQLIEDGIYDQDSLPSVSFIDRILRGGKHRPNGHSIEAGVQLKRKKCRSRIIFSNDQIDALEQIFENTLYPDVHTREKLTRSTGLTEARVKVWFLNRRARLRKQLKRQPSFAPNASCRSSGFGTTYVAAADAAVGHQICHDPNMGAAASGPAPAVSANTAYEPHHTFAYSFGSLASMSRKP